MNIERFHNELAMRLGYERIVKDKRILISVEESEDPLVTLMIEGCEDVSFKASEEHDNALLSVESELRDEIKQISDAVRNAYSKSICETFACYNGIR